MKECVMLFAEYYAQASDAPDLGQSLALLLVVAGAIILFRKATKAVADNKETLAKGGVSLLQQWLNKK
jgi:hypothetical protein